MSNFDYTNLTLSHDSDITAHMPQLFQLMIRIQQEAEQEFNNIVVDIELDKTTLEEVKRERGAFAINEPTPATILAYARAQTCHQGGAHVPEHWDVKLFSKPYHQIIGYIENIFKNTLNEVEYYHTIPFLMQDIPKERLFVPFRKSPQYVQMLQNENGRRLIVLVVMLQQSYNNKKKI